MLYWLNKNGKKSTELKFQFIINKQDSKSKWGTEKERLLKNGL